MGVRQSVDVTVDERTAAEWISAVAKGKTEKIHSLRSAMFEEPHRHLILNAMFTSTTAQEKNQFLSHLFQFVNTDGVDAQVEAIDFIMYLLENTEDLVTVGTQLLTSGVDTMLLSILAVAADATLVPKFYEPYTATFHQETTLVPIDSLMKLVRFFSGHPNFVVAAISSNTPSFLLQYIPFPTTFRRNCIISLAMMCQMKPVMFDNPQLHEVAVLCQILKDTDREYSNSAAVILLSMVQHGAASTIADNRQLLLSVDIMVHLTHSLTVQPAAFGDEMYEKHLHTLLRLYDSTVSSAIQASRLPADLSVLFYLIDLFVRFIEQRNDATRRSRTPTPTPSRTASTPAGESGVGGGGRNAVGTEIYSNSMNISIPHQELAYVCYTIISKLVRGICAPTTSMAASTSSLYGQPVSAPTTSLLSSEMIKEADRLSHVLLSGLVVFNSDTQLVQKIWLVASTTLRCLVQADSYFAVVIANHDDVPTFLTKISNLENLQVLSEVLDAFQCLVSYHSLKKVELSDIIISAMIMAVSTQLDTLVEQTNGYTDNHEQAVVGDAHQQQQQLDGSIRRCIMVLSQLCTSEFLSGYTLVVDTFPLNSIADYLVGHPEDQPSKSYSWTLMDSLLQNATTTGLVLASRLPSIFGIESPTAAAGAVVGTFPLSPAGSDTSAPIFPSAHSPPPPSTNTMYPPVLYSPPHQMAMPQNVVPTQAAPPPSNITQLALLDESKHQLSLQELLIQYTERILAVQKRCIKEKMEMQMQSERWMNLLSHKFNLLTAVISKEARSHSPKTRSTLTTKIPVPSDVERREDSTFNRSDDYHHIVNKKEVMAVDRKEDNIFDPHNFAVLLPSASHIPPLQVTAKRRYKVPHVMKRRVLMQYASASPPSIQAPPTVLSAVSPDKTTASSLPAPTPGQESAARAIWQNIQLKETTKLEEERRAQWEAEQKQQWKKRTEKQQMLEQHLVQQNRLLSDQTINREELESVEAAKRHATKKEFLFKLESIEIEGQHRRSLYHQEREGVVADEDLQRTQIVVLQQKAVSEILRQEAVQHMETHDMLTRRREEDMHAKRAEARKREAEEKEREYQTEEAKERERRRAEQADLKKWEEQKQHYMQERAKWDQDRRQWLEEEQQERVRVAKYYEEQQKQFEAQMQQMKQLQVADRQPQSVAAPEVIASTSQYSALSRTVALQQQEEAAAHLRLSQTYTIDPTIEQREATTITSRLQLSNTIVTDTPSEVVVAPSVASPLESLALSPPRELQLHLHATGESRVVVNFQGIEKDTLAHINGLGNLAYIHRGGNKQPYALLLSQKDDNQSEFPWLHSLHAITCSQVSESLPYVSGLHKASLLAEEEIKQQRKASRSQKAQTPQTPPRPRTTEEERAARMAKENIEREAQERIKRELMELFGQVVNQLGNAESKQRYKIENDEDRERDIMADQLMQDISATKERLLRGSAALAVQTEWRRWAAKRDVNRKKVEVRSAVLIQKVLRGLLIRNRVNRMKQAVGTISNHYADFATRKNNKKTSAATKIQLQWKRHRAHERYLQIRCKLQQEEDEKDSAMELQRLWRGYLDRRRYKELREKKLLDDEEKRLEAERTKKMLEDEAARWRVLEAMKQQEAEAELQRKRNKAATDIQRVYKGGKVRQSLYTQQVAAAKIQPVYRGHMARVQFRKKMLKKKKAQEKSITDQLQQALQQHAPAYALKQEKDVSKSKVKKKGKPPLPGTESPSPSQPPPPVLAKEKKKPKKKPEQAPPPPPDTPEKILAELDSQQANLMGQGLSQDALELYWRSLQIRREYYGPTHAHTEDNALTIAEISNAIATELISGHQHMEANKLLQTCDTITTKVLEDATRNHRRLMTRAKMYHNLTCIKKSKGDIRRALKFAEKALAVMLHLQLLDQLPTSYLNVCALYSNLGLHAEALRHAYMSLQVVKELIELTNADKDVMKQIAPALPKVSDISAVSNLSNLPDLSALVGYADLSANRNRQEVEEIKQQRLSQFHMQLAITYFNVAVEQEYLGQPEQCVNTYQLAYVQAHQQFGPSNPLTMKFKKALKKVQQEQQQQQHHPSEGAFMYNNTSNVRGNYSSNSSDVSFPAADMRTRGGGLVGVKGMRDHKRGNVPKYSKPTNRNNNSNLRNVSPISATTATTGVPSPQPRLNLSPPNSAPSLSNGTPLSYDNSPHRGQMLVLSGMDYVTTVDANGNNNKQNKYSQQPQHGLSAPLQPRAFLPLVPHDEMVGKASAALAAAEGNISAEQLAPATRQHLQPIKNTRSGPV